MSSRSTIAALSSGRLPSAIAIIRISGPQAFPAVTALITPPGSAPRVLPKPRRASLRRLYRHHDSAVLDEALVLLFPSPDSATGEDLAELHVHGSPAIVAALLETLAALGVRSAEPGQFTRRAFEAGRLDLTQVEGLADLLAATTEAQRAQAAAQANGALRRSAENWRDRLIAILAEVEAQIDFSDEADTAAATLDPAALDTIISELHTALAGYSAGERIREGLTCAIIGPPNVGKSSLLNALVARDAAIVSPIPGTTRDLIEAQAVFGGVPVTLIDTAGLRPSTDPIEAEGIARARSTSSIADIVIAVTTTESWPDIPTTIRVVNKVDLAEVAASVGRDDLGVSARTGQGLDLLRSRLTEIVAAQISPGEPSLVTRLRQHNALVHAGTSASAARTLEDPALVAELLRASLHALAALGGRSDVEAVLGAIFERFCIGK